MQKFRTMLIHLVLLAGTWGLRAHATPEDSMPYRLGAESREPCHKEAMIDVNRGPTPEAFVTDAACQVSGWPADAKTVADWSEKLRNDPTVRRADVIKSLCNQFSRTCQLRYSDPWNIHEESTLIDCVKRGRRDIGAVVMFFFHCPDGDNCHMDWAGSHAPGMDRPDRRLGFGPQASGYYNADNPGFWAFELRQARAAGLQFILPNVYGPDMAQGQIDTLVRALKTGAQGVIKVGLFDDTWAWGEGKFGEPWARAPDLSDTDVAANQLYRLKWQAFFRKIPADDWYRIDGRPVIYFYNAGTLKPANKGAAVIARMKTLFKSDFGVEPYVAVDDAFFADPGMASVADTRFRWDTFSAPFAATDGTVELKNNISWSRMQGRVMTSAMVRWDSRSRDALEGHPDAFSGRIAAGPGRLKAVLDATQGADSLLLETWNDLGEGTGVDWNYDYSYRGKWLQPNAFIEEIRASQCKTQ